MNRPSVVLFPVSLSFNRTADRITETTGQICPCHIVKSFASSFLYWILPSIVRKHSSRLYLPSWNCTDIRYRYVTIEIINVFTYIVAECGDKWIVGWMGGVGGLGRRKGYLQRLVHVRISSNSFSDPLRRYRLSFSFSPSIHPTIYISLSLSLSRSQE